MNEAAIFLIGIIIFAITIYGAVMAGGMALTSVVLDQEPQRQPEAQGRPAGLEHLAPQTLTARVMSFGGRKPFFRPVRRRARGGRRGRRRAQCRCHPFRRSRRARGAPSSRPPRSRTLRWERESAASGRAVGEVDGRS